MSIFQRRSLSALRASSAGTQGQSLCLTFGGGGVGKGGWAGGDTGHGFRDESLGWMAVLVD